MNKKIIRYGCLTLGLAAVISFSAVAIKFAGADEDVGDITVTDEKVGKYDLCNHDESFKEPELEVGKYYFNGDENAKYIEVKGDGKLYFMGGTAEDFAADLYDSREVFEEDLKNPESGAEKNVEDFSAPREYLVYTSHLASDNTYVFYSWSVEESDGQELVNGIGYRLDNGDTLSLNDKAEYVLKK